MRRIDVAFFGHIILQLTAFRCYRECIKSGRSCSNVIRTVKNMHTINPQLGNIGSIRCQGYKGTVLGNRVGSTRNWKRRYWEKFLK